MVSGGAHARPLGWAHVPTPTGGACAAGARPHAAWPYE
jgi:hypothetical protein